MRRSQREDYARGARRDNQSGAGHAAQWALAPGARDQIAMSLAPAMGPVDRLLRWSRHLDAGVARRGEGGRALKSPRCSNASSPASSLDGRQHLGGLRPAAPAVGRPRHAGLPAQGMAALPATSRRCHPGDGTGAASRSSAISPTGVTTGGRRARGRRRRVVAAEPRTANRLVGSPLPAMKGLVTDWFVADEAPIDSDLQVVESDARAGQSVNAAVVSDAAASYAGGTPPASRRPRGWRRAARGRPSQRCGPTWSHYSAPAQTRASRSPATWSVTRCLRGRRP